MEANRPEMGPGDESGSILEYLRMLMDAKKKGYGTRSRNKGVIPGGERSGDGSPPEGGFTKAVEATPLAGSN